MMYYYNHGFYPEYMFGFGHVFMLVFWIVVIYLLVKFLRKGKVCEICGHNNNALEIAKERYAKGEITKEQLDEMKKELK